MSRVTKEEWIEWKNHPVTKAFYEAVEIRVEESKDLLSYSAGVDQAQDNYWRGFIGAYREMLEFKIEDIDED